MLYKNEYDHHISYYDVVYRLNSELKLIVTYLHS